MKHSIHAGSLVLALLASPAWAQSPPLSDTEFVTKASVGNAFEIAEARLALEKATDQKLRDFAKDMIKDHTDAENKLRDAAGKDGNALKTTLDQQHQAMLDNLRTFSGKDFDKIYTTDQIFAHVETVALLSDYQQNGKNSDLTSWISKSLPIVKGHLAAVNAM